ncbi:hypothetical protein TrVE_jg9062 [Triparma verrucosa]|nr:hypothetical protein TrVE_jg9062 [Triparma verrucosa]
MSSLTSNSSQNPILLTSLPNSSYSSLLTSPPSTLIIYALVPSPSSPFIPPLTSLKNVQTIIFILGDSEVEDLALDLGLTNVNTASLKTSTGILIHSFKHPTIPVEIQNIIDEGTAGYVRSGYSKTVNDPSGGEGCCVSVDSEMNGYTREQLIAAGEESNLGLGCGNPLSLAMVKAGEVVVDLGSGAGIDCFIAATQVQPGGKVIGIDMTPDMITKARANAKVKGFADEEVHFRLGEIEYLPVADSSADCVIRAPEKETLMASILAAGFVDVKIEEKEESREVIKQWLPGSGAEDYVVSADITAKKP